jgi:hypothetical protein
MKILPCVNTKCAAYNSEYEYNCEINGFTYAIGCKQQEVKEQQSEQRDKCKDGK